MAGSRHALMKEDSKSVILELKITSYWSSIGGTNLGSIDMKKFQGILYTTKPTRPARAMIESGIIKVDGSHLAVTSAVVVAPKD